MSKVPKIRFKGYTDDWEQRRFSDVVDIGSGMDYKHLGEGDIPVYGTGGYMLSVDAALSEDKDAIGIGRKGTIDKPYILRAPFWTVDTLFYCIPKDGMRAASKKGKSGFIWHTTGSGKTMTSYKATRNLLMDIPAIEKTVFLIDRKDLDMQTKMAFQSYADNDTIDVDDTDNVNELIRKMSDEYS